MLIQELTLKGLLSFGPDTPPLKLRPLNVLIGPNGSGKSNLIEAIGLLRSSAKRLAAPFSGPSGGGVGEWIWKGSKYGTAHIDAVIESNAADNLRHTIEFRETSGRFELADEKIEFPEPDRGHSDLYFFYKYMNGRPMMNIKEWENRRLKPMDPVLREDLDLNESVLAQIRDPRQYPELAELTDNYSKIRLYREWNFGRNSTFRLPQAADLPGDRLEENFSNLGLFLSHLRETPLVKRQINDHIKDLYQGLEDFDVRLRSGTVEVTVTEGDFTIPASRLSDGTLRYLCLLAILCDPNPPKLICIEEPELGLHPDIIHKLAQLLIDASERTQLIVTTHSDLLVGALSDTPESVVVVEKDQGQTQMQRLDSDELDSWLEKYSLGELWMRGQIGGTRW